MKKFKCIVHVIGLIVVLFFTTARADGPANITWVRTCTDYGGLTAYGLSDGKIVFLYAGADQGNKNMHSLMAAAWASGKRLSSYDKGNCGSNCNVWACVLNSVTFDP